ncbi:hypothetical protein CEXT_31111 [Caerostris extrusa]|uniref:Uncharacterized protein n=1 Tax=Caerostris extrusa TaxID=172846 RepID=A0AAV4XIN2_CAEEX|nr:hypothetical protein CEXT_31111 [Caerostris extrusa]
MRLNIDLQVLFGTVVLKRVRQGALRFPGAPCCVPKKYRKRSELRRDNALSSFGQQTSFKGLLAFWQNLDFHHVFFRFEVDVGFLSVVGRVLITLSILGRFLVIGALCSIEGDDRQQRNVSGCFLEVDFIAQYLLARGSGRGGCHF